MKTNGRFIYGIVAGSLLFPILHPGTGLCRDNIVIGRLSVTTNYSERSYDALPAGEDDTPDRDENRGDRRDITVTPGITLISTGPTDQVELTYEPGLVYDDLDSETDVDHTFTLLATKDLSPKWQVTLEEQYIMSDDPLRRREEISSAVEEERSASREIRPVDEGGLTESQGRRRYWTNDIAIGTEYRYAEGSSFGIGYAYDVLRNEDENAGYAEHDRHDYFFRLEHRFSGQWRAELEPHYIVGTVDNPVIEGESTPASDDLTQVELAAEVDYQPQTQDSYIARYRYLQADYDNPDEEDSKIHALRLGWEHNFDEHYHLTLSGGPSLIKLEDRSWESDYNIYAELMRDFSRGHGEASLYAEKGYDLDSFSGTDAGLTDFWRIGTIVNYQWTEAFSTEFTASYRDNRRLEEPTSGTLASPTVVDDDFDYHEKFTEFGISLSYEFMRYYTLSLGYRFLQSDSDLVGEDYDDHRIFLELSFTRNLFRF